MSQTQTKKSSLQRRINFASSPKTCSLRTSATNIPRPEKSPPKSPNRRGDFVAVTKDSGSPASKSMMLGARRRNRMKNNHNSTLRAAKKTNKQNTK